MALKNWYETLDASDCLKDNVTWNDMIDYIKHSACTDFTIHSTCTSTGQAFRFTHSGTESLMYGGTTTGDDLKIQANDADTYPYLYMYGDGDIELHSSNDVIFYDDADEEFKFYDNSIDIKADRALYIDDDETYLGHGAGDSITTGYNNTLIGHDAGNAITSGIENTIVGKDAGMNITTNGNNTLIGTEAGSVNTFEGCTFLGDECGKSNTKNEIVGVGHHCLENNTGNYVVGMGDGALFNNQGENNTVIGHYGGYAITSGYANTGLGSQSLVTDTTGYENTAVGAFSLFTNISGNQNTGVGYQVGYSAATDIDGCVYLGYKAGYSNPSDNRLYINNSDSLYSLIYGEFDNDVVKFGDNDTNWFAQFERNGAADMRWYGGEDANDELIIFANSNDTYPQISLTNGIVTIASTNNVQLRRNATTMFKFDRSAPYSRIYGGTTTGDDTVIYANQTDTYSYIILNGNGNIQLYSGSEVEMFDTGDRFMWFYEDGTDDTIEGATTNNDLYLKPNGSGVVKFGTYAAIVAETLQGYITIKDAAGNTRKLGVVA